MYAFITILIIIVCLLIIGIVLVQNPKGGGLGAGFGGGGGGGGALGGVQKTTDFLEKGTWALAIALLVLSIISTIAIDKNNRVDTFQSDTEVLDRLEE